MNDAIAFTENTKLDFLRVSGYRNAKGKIDIYPEFVVGKSSDLMIRGGDFYAVWDDEKGFWSTDEDDVSRMVDSEIRRIIKEMKQSDDWNAILVPHYMWSSRSGSIDAWHKYCKQQMRDSFHILDEKLIFSNTKTTKKDYASKALSYPLEEGDISAYDKMLSVLYSPEERKKLEWAIGSIVSGDSKKIQKFMVLYGAPKTGKSTVLDIIQELFDGYTSAFDAKAVGSSNNSFALEDFKSNPLVAIQHDGDLSHIEDNARLNSLVSHELMTVNEKFKSTYTTRFKSFLFMGTNKPVRITDSKSGLLRRLIDVTPTGEKIPKKEYDVLKKQISFELGAIAYHCLQVYNNDPTAYDDYVPLSMMGATNDFYNFMLDSYLIFAKQDGTTMKAAWEMYKQYCDEAKVPYPLSQRLFKVELAEYFETYEDRPTLEDGTRPRSWYGGFKKAKFEPEKKKKAPEGQIGWLIFKKQKSVFDTECGDLMAQYANEKGTPCSKWSEVTTKLSDLDTSLLHYVRVPLNHIVIDFDIPDEEGNKCLERNLEAAAKWPPTYAELSKSGQGIHLHYIYAGDPNDLEGIYSPHIEIKVFRGNSALRRLLSKCNDLKIAVISSGLPKKEKKMVSIKSVQSEKGLRDLIARNLNKEIQPSTKSSIDFIWKILDDAYNSDLKYDVSDMRQAVLNFAMRSTNKSKECIKKVADMKFCSKEASENTDNSEAPIVFYDVEVFPNLFLVNWKYRGKDKKCVRLINPKPADIEELIKFRLIGFNCRRYDNHMLYACLIGKTNLQIYELSQKIINEGKGFFKEAYNLSYTDVYDFASTKQSLKKWEIQLGIHHQELGLPWDQPVPEELWTKVAEYCDNDVIATEATFECKDIQADFLARTILADIAGMTVNDTTNMLTTRIIFGTDRAPQSRFNYRNMGDGSQIDRNFLAKELREQFDEYTAFRSDGKPVFPDYVYDAGKSIYRGEEVGEGGYVYAEPGIYKNIALLDIASMHPSSIIAEDLFGEEYTKGFSDILQTRLLIKHKDYEKAKTMFGGRLAKYLTDKDSAKALSKALKIAINSVYGLTSAKFDNAFRDLRNKDNIVAKRGALFMVNLKHEVQKRGFTVAHIKTDSIKIPDATPDIIQFVMTYGRMYGYAFEHEATYERMCLVNDAVYIAKFADKEDCIRRYGYCPDENEELGSKWTATGTQFQVPYVFKTLFSKEEIEFGDLCETKSVSKGSIYIDMDESVPEGEHDYVFIGRVGLFCPIHAGYGGGSLFREADGKYYALSGTKGYHWLEAEVVQRENKQDCIDRSYYDELCTKAVEAISKYGSFEDFVSTPISEWPPEPELPF